MILRWPVCAAAASSACTSRSSCSGVLRGTSTMIAAFLLAGELPVKRQIQSQHVDARFTQQAERWSFGGLGDQLADHVRRGAARFGDAGGLSLRIRGADVWIEPAAGAGDGVGGNRRQGADAQRVFRIVERLDQLDVVE